jgi:hypothetical protein
LAVRTGTLWEGRYKASLVDSESHVLHCQRYIDLNPVRARMTDDPADYPRSSCPAHCGRRSDAMLTPRPAYTALASEPEARSEAYRLLLREGLSDDDLATIRTYLQQQRALGRDDSARWSKRRLNALPASGLRTDRHVAIQTLVSEPDPVFARCANSYLDQ